jgi:rod shape-determining protein MreD
MSGVRTAMVITALIGLVLTVLPLPSWVAPARPAFLVLTVLYWSMAVPRAGGIGLGWFSGLLLDVFQGPLLGEHALALSAAAYVFVKEHQRIRSKPVFQQALIVCVALGFYEFIVFAIDGWSGHALTSPLRWIHIVTGALVWPAAAAILAQTYDRRS